MWKTVGMRIRSTEQELKDAGEDTDGMVESTAKLREMIQGLTGFDIMADEAGTQFKDLYDITIGIGDEWKNLTDVEQAGLLETLAGKNQGNALAATLNNVDKIKEIYNTAEFESDGSAQKENERYLDSINGKLNILQSSFQSLSTTAINSDFVKGSIDGLTALVDILDFLIDKLGILGTLTIGGGVVGLVKNLESFEGLGTLFNSVKTGGLLNIINNFKEFNQVLDTLGGRSISNVTKVASVFKTLNETNEASKAGSVIKDIASSISALKNGVTTFENGEGVVRTIATAMQGLSTTSKAAVLSMFDLNAAQAQAILTAAGLSGAELKTAVATATAGTAASGAAGGFAAFTASVQAAFTGLITFLTATPAGWFVIAAASIAGAVVAFDYFTESMGEAKEKAAESRDAYNQTASEVESLTSKLDETKTRIAELQAQDSLSIADENELSKLQAQNEQLSLQLKIKQKLASYQQQKSAEDSNNVLTKKGYTIRNPEQGGDISKRVDIIDNVSSKQDTLNQKTEEYNKLLKKQANTDPKSLGYKENQRQIDAIEKQMDNLNDGIAKDLAVIEQEYASLFDENGNVIPGYEDTVERIRDLINKIGADDLDTGNTDKATESITATKEQLESLGDEFKKQKNGISEWFDSLSDEDKQLVYQIKVESEDTASWTLDQWKNALNEASAAADTAATTVETLKTTIADATTYQKNYSDALASSKSATGLTTDEIKALTDAYSDLEDFDAGKLFENTANGVHLNKQELEWLNDELQRSKLEEFAKKMESLQNDLTSAILKGEDTSAITAEIQEVARLQSQYEGLCSAYNKWVTAKSGANERDSYESIGSDYDNMKEAVDSGWFDDESLNAYLDLLLSAEKRTGDAEKDFKQLNKTISGTSHSLMDYWQYDSESDKLVSDGLYDFLDDVRKKLGDSYAKINKDGEYVFDFTGKKLEDVADAFGTTTEMIQLFERALSDAGNTINLGDNLNVDTLQEKLKAVNDTLKSLGKDPVDIDINVSNTEQIASEIENARNLVNSMTTEEGKIKVGFDQADYNNALGILSGLEQKKEVLSAPVLMKLKLDDSSDVSSAVNTLQKFKKENANLNTNIAVKADTTESQKKIQEIAKSISNMPDEVKTSLGLDDTAFQSALSAILSTEVDVQAGVNLNQSDIEVILSYINSISPEMLVTAGVDKSAVEKFMGENHDTESTVVYNVDSNKVVSFKQMNHDIASKVKYSSIFDNKSAPVLRGTIYYTSRTDGAPGSRLSQYMSKVNGTAHANGTAFQKGDWGIKGSGTALGGELGEEIVVRNGHFFTIGDNGAEFFKYQPNDIIFNHKQTEELFKYGKVLSDGGRGMAFVDGTAFDSGSGGSRRKKKTSTVSATKKSSSSKSSSSSKKSSSNSKKSSTSKKSSSKSSSSSSETEEQFDWIEIAVNRVAAAIDRLKIIADSAFKSFSTRTSYLNQEIRQTNREINIQQKAYKKYMQLANSVGLSSSWAAKVRNGSINVSTVKNKDLAEKIKLYQNYYEKALDSKKAILELKEAESELYVQRMKLIQTQYNSKDEYYNTLSDNLDALISYREDRGYTYSSKPEYKKAQSYTMSRQANLIKERNSLQSQLNKAVKNGAIKKYSEAWYEWQNEINSLNGDIYSCAQKLQEYATKIANIPIEKMNVKLDKINDNLDILEAKYTTAQSANSKNTILKDENAQRKKELNAYQTAYKETKKYTNSLWNSADIKKARKSQSNKGKTNGDLLSVKGIKVNSKEYKAILNYNAAIKAQQEAYVEAKKKSYEYTAALRENTKKMFDNIQSEYESKQSPTNALISYYNSWLSYRDSTGKSQTSDDQKKIYNKAISNNQTLLKSQEAELAELQKNYKKNKKNMSAEDARQAQAEIYALQESILNTKASIGELQAELDNIEVKKLEISLDRLSAKASKFQDAIDLKEAKGLSADASDYVALIKNSEQQVENYEKQNELLRQQQEQYSTNSEKYQELQKQIESNEEAIRAAQKQQIEWNNSIANIPIEKLEKALELVEAITDYEQSLVDLKVAEGKVVTEDDYLNQIRSENQKLEQLQQEREILYDYYQKALESEDGTYAGKTADEWKKEYTDLDTEINNTKIDIIKLQEEMDNLSVKKLQNEMDQLEHTASKLQSDMDIKETKGVKATTSDYQALISNSKEQESNLKEQNRLLEKQLSEVEEGSDKYYEIKQQINDNEEAIANCEKQQAEWNVAMENLPIERLEEALDLLDAIDEKTKSEIDLKVAKGEDLTAEDYQKQISDNNDQINNLQEKKSEMQSNYQKALSSEDGTYGGKTADEWSAEINKAEADINNLKVENEELKDSLRDDVYWRQFERMHKEAERTSDVLSGMADLIDDDMAFDSDGNLTQYGVDKMALLIKQYETARKEVQNYQNDIDNLNKLYQQGEYTQEEYNEKLAELQSGMLDAASDMKNYQDSIIEMQKKMAQNELDNLTDLIDKRNEALKAKKSYYDYDKTIREKTKDIKALQAQISALEGVDTAEARAKRAKLNAQLKDSQDDLDDTIKEHLFEISQDSLTEMKEALQDAFDEKWDNIVSNMDEIQKLMNDANEIVSSSAAEVNGSLNEILKYYGINSKSGVSGNVVSNGSTSSASSGSSSSIPSGASNGANNSTVDSNGDRFFVRDSDGSVLIPLDYGKNIIPSDFIDSLKEWTNYTPESMANALMSNLPKDIPLNDIANNISYNFGSLLNVQGNVDSTVVTDLNKFVSQFYKGAYNYMVKEMTRDARKNGIKV